MLPALPILFFGLLPPTTATPPLPRLVVSLKPIFSHPSNPPNSQPEISALSVSLTLTGTPYLNPMLSHIINNGATKTIQHIDLPAFDEAGPFPFTTFIDTNTSNAIRFWSAVRQPIGDVTVGPLIITPPASLGVGNGPRIDLRRDPGGGLVGLGEGFLPRPAVDEEWDVTVRWEGHDEFPRGFRAVSSLGEGTEERIVGRPGRVLDKNYFAVGRLGRWPSWGKEEVQTDKDGKGEFAIYWMGDAPPWDMESLGERVRKLTEAVRGFFGEPQDSFRMFWRRAARGYGGAGGFRSFMLEYAEFAEEELTGEALENLIAHESIHGYALMNPVRQEDVWYREGIAVYYAVVAPFLAGSVDTSYLLRWMNNNAQAYYTGGTTNLSWKYVLDHYWTSTPLARTSYYRGFIYLVYCEGLITKATNGSKNLDDVVLGLYRRYKADYPTQSEHFVTALGDFVGKENAEASFRLFTSGDLIVPAADSVVRFRMKMERTSCEKLELGFSEGSLGTGVISELVAGSRAEEAGLREGDKLVRSWGFSTAGDSLDNKLKVVVRRGEEQVAITFRPRSREKVDCYQLVDM